MVIWLSNTTVYWRYWVFWLNNATKDIFWIFCQCGIPWKTKKNMMIENCAFFFFINPYFFSPLLWPTGKNVNYNKNIQQTQIYNCISVEISKVLKLQVSFMGPMKERYRAIMKQRDRRTELLKQRTILWSCSPIIMILSSLGGLPNIICMGELRPMNKVKWSTIWGTTHIHKFFQCMSINMRREMFVILKKII